MAEWSKAPHSKCGKRVKPLRGFESLSLRAMQSIGQTPHVCGVFSYSGVPVKACFRQEAPGYEKVLASASLSIDCSRIEREVAGAAGQIPFHPASAIFPP